MEFTPIETQEELNNVISARLKEEKARTEKKYSDYLSPEAFEEKTKDMTSKIASLTEELAKAKESADANVTLLAERDKTIKAYEIASVKTKIAGEMGFSLDAIQFLSGDDEETIRSSAESLKTLIGTKTAPMASSEVAIGDSTQAALKGMLNNLS